MKLNNVSISISLPDNIIIMSAKTETQHSAPSPSPSPSSVVKDVALWRRKSLTATIIIGATLTWTLLQVYQFHVVTLFSWVLMFFLASSFLWANMLRLFGKTPPNLSDLELLSEESALKGAYVARAWIEEGIKLVFRVGAQEDWSLFLGAVAALFLLSYVARYMDLLTLLYIGTLTSTTVPVIYNKNKNRMKSSLDWLRENSKRSVDWSREKSKISMEWSREKSRSLMEWLRVKSKRAYEILDERVIQKIKHRVVNENEMKRANEKKAH